VFTVLGAPIRLKASFVDATGAYVDPTTVTAVITGSDGNPVAGSPFAAARDTQGQYHYDYTPSSLTGIYQFYFVGAGTNAAIQPADVFTVSPVTTAALISLSDAKEQLNKAASSPNPTPRDDSEILGFIRSASFVINHISGFTLATTFADFVTPSWGAISGISPMSGYIPIAVTRTPLLSVSVIQPQFYQAAAVDVSQIVINSEAGIIYLPTSSLFLGPCVVTYKAGRTSVPTILQTACRIIVQSLWETQRGPTGNPSLGPANDMVAVPGMGVSIPAHAMELLVNSPYRAAPGFA